ncbi:MAG: argininosuccinate lyase [bacterium]|nr:argininosuccinate lyase [bacterium]
MRKPVWHSEKKGSAKEAFVAFSAGRDVVPLPEADQDLVPYDIWTNQAHALTLYRGGVFSREEARSILAALIKLKEDWLEGCWHLDPTLEDVHINIEAYITEHCGEALGGRLHSGRSRNDQVANDMKLYARDVILEFCQETTTLISAILTHAASHLQAVMPGYTHHRKATITTWAHWCASYTQGLRRDAQRWMDLYHRINTCPLGAAASYGTTWPLDREYTAQLMAFDGPQENTLDAVMSRGEAETEITQALALLMKRLACVSQDLILFSTEEFGYLSLPPAFTTGSSIMPQKRNPDFAEAIKGKAQAVQGYCAALTTINAANLAGYNKDVQWTKYQFMDAVREARHAARILADVFQGLHVHTDRMTQAARTGFLNAVDIADFLAQSRQVPFRQTYRILSDAVGLSTEGFIAKSTLNTLLQKDNITLLTDEEYSQLTDPVRCVMNRTHCGSPHPEQVNHALHSLSTQQAALLAWIEAQQNRIAEAKQRCTGVELMDRAAQPE